jgi:uncharacterized membrane protein
MSYMIAAGFHSAHAAYLVRAALARMQTDLSLSERDLVVLTRTNDGRAHICETVEIEDVYQPRETFWAVFVRLLLNAGSSLNTPSAGLTAIGIDSTCRGHLKALIRENSSSILVLVDGRIMRDQVLGVLRGFHGTVFQIRLRGSDRAAWWRALTDSPSEA